MFFTLFLIGCGDDTTNLLLLDGGLDSPACSHSQCGGSCNDGAIEQGTCFEETRCVCVDHQWHQCFAGFEYDDNEIPSEGSACCTVGDYPHESGGLAGPVTPGKCRCDETHHVRDCSKDM
jgi:hypothetical protein